MSATITAIGACVMDTLVQVPRFPAEDTKLRATSSKPAGGGPAATGLVAAAKLGESTAFIGVLSNDSAGHFLLDDFTRYGVDVSGITLLDGYRAFTSVIWLSEETASRTCVFDKGNLPALCLTDATAKLVADAKLLMVDGNELAGALAAAKVARENGTTVLYDCGGLYEGIEPLLSLTDIMIPSEEFALGHTGCASAEEAARRLYERYHPRVVVITQGVKGGLHYDGQTLTRYPAFPVHAVDSNGSGDVFHGAFAAGLCKGFDTMTCCIFASAVSAIKCTGVGARESVPDFAAVKDFLKENGYEF